RCQPLTEWKVLGEGEEELIPYLVVVVGGVASCPVRLPQSQTEERYSTTVGFPAAAEKKVQEPLVLTLQHTDGQMHVLLWDQPCPQLTVHNNTNNTVLFAKARTDGAGGHIPDCEHLRWQLEMAPGTVAYYSFPVGTLAPDPGLPNTLPPAAIAVLSPLTAGPKWSDAISLTHCTGRLLTLLGLPDLSLSVCKRGFTTHVTLMQASHTEILAVDIRGQLTRQLLNERRISNTSHHSVEEVESSMDNEPSPPPSFPPSESGAVEVQGLDISCYVHGLTGTLLCESQQGCESHEVAALTMDCVAVTLHPHPHQLAALRSVDLEMT
ncbi:hypothetical protein J6590_103623, partial [Homalodisca vitripennis]